MNEEGKMKNPTGQNTQQSQGVAGEGKPGSSGDSAAQDARYGYQDPIQDKNKNPDENMPGPAYVACIPPETVKDKLDQMKKDSQTAQIESENDKKLSDCLKGKNDELYKLYNDIVGIMDAYSQGYETLKEQLDCMEENNKTRLKDIPSKTKDDILGKVIKKTDDNISCLSKCKDKFECLCEQEDQCVDEDYKCCEDKPAVDLACTPDNLKKLISVKQAADKLAKSERNHYWKEKKFNELKDLKSTIEAHIKTVQEYQTKINAARNDDSKCKMYTYILLIKTILDKTKLPKPDQMQKKLEKALEALRCAKIDMCMQEYVKNKVNDTLEAIKNDLNDAEKNRENDILEQISRISN